MLSKRIASITPSATHAMTARIAEKRAAGDVPEPGTIRAGDVFA